MITIVSGTLCLMAAIFLFVQIRKTQDLEPSTAYKKFSWIFFTILIMSAIHNIFTGVSAPWLEGLINGLDVLIYILLSVAGVVLGVSLSIRAKQNIKP